MARSRKVAGEPTEVFPIDDRPAGWRAAAQLAGPLLLGAALLGGLLWAGREARQRLRQRGEGTFAVAEVECPPPPGMQRRQFLEEAQYLAGLPDRLDADGGDGAERLAAALAQHPWVARVERVERLGDGRLRAALTYREPALAVAAPARVVDRHGTLLPLGASREGLPVLAGPVPAPPAPGRPWADARVKAAARVAHYLGPHLAALGLAGCAVEVERDEVTLRARGAVVRWGSPPGKEKPGEPPAAAKLRRLRGRGAAEGEIDLRRAER